jgi:hypothetical protein
LRFSQVRLANVPAVMEKDAEFKNSKSLMADNHFWQRTGQNAVTDCVVVCNLFFRYFHIIFVYSKFIFDFVVVIIILLSPLLFI